MHVLHAANPDEGLAIGLSKVVKLGGKSPSRNGPVLRFRGPATMVWTHPCNRVSFSDIRDANPTFALMESLWMLCGRNDIEPMVYYARQMQEYSDDGKTFNAAYGYRWRNHFGHDQMLEAVELLKKDSSTRQVVIQIWDHQDLMSKTKDRACNTTVMFDAQFGKLDMLVTNRSNDMIWGMCGANVVHFSFLQEFVSVCTGIPVGTYYQVANNLHVYTEFDISKRFIKPTDRGTFELDYGSISYTDLYKDVLVRHHPMDAQDPSFLVDANNLVSNHQNIGMLSGIKSTFLREVAEPMRQTYAVWKSGMKDTAYKILKASAESYVRTYHIPNDWLTAGIKWMERRLFKEQK